jgi:protein tyrosine/serine phosphatase
MRHLTWDGCVNVRDLGGLETEEGAVTRRGWVVRADNIAELTPEGWHALDAHGVRTAIDLRFDTERTPHPSHARPIGVVHIPLFGRLDRRATERVDRMVLEAPDAGSAIRRMYEDALVTHRERIGQALHAVATALDGGAVVVHCAIGKDRTGIVSALLLRLAGVSIADVADDYALSHDRVRPLVDPWIAEAATAEERALRTRFCSAPRDGMHGMLEALEERHGGAVRFLRSAGLDEARLAGLRERLLQPA